MPILPILRFQPPAAHYAHRLPPGQWRPQPFSRFVIGALVPLFGIACGGTERPGMQGVGGVSILGGSSTNGGVSSKPDSELGGATRGDETSTASQSGGSAVHLGGSASSVTSQPTLPVDGGSMGSVGGGTSSTATGGTPPLGGTSGGAAATGGSSSTNVGTGGTSVAGGAADGGLSPTGGVASIQTVPVTGGASATGGTSGVTGGSSTADTVTGGATLGSGGAAAGTGGTLAAGDLDAGSAGASSVRFFAFGDSHIGQAGAGSENFVKALARMEALDPNALAAINNGDLLDDSSSKNWSTFESLLESSRFRRDLGAVEGAARFFAVLGNHDLGFPAIRNDWLSRWNEHLPYQETLGHNGIDGVYFAVQLCSALIVALESEPPSSAQTSWLQDVLTSEQATKTTAKIVFFHRPVYPCSTAHSPYEEGLQWVDLFERHGVQLVFVSHLHDYERTCAMRSGACASSGGVVYVNLGPLGATNYRSADRQQAVVEGRDAEGTPRTDRYGCAGTGKVLEFTQTGTNTFCHVEVDACHVRGNCYSVGGASSEPFDAWQLDVCDD